MGPLHESVGAQNLFKLYRNILSNRLAPRRSTRCRVPWHTNLAWPLIDAKYWRSWWVANFVSSLLKL